MFLHVPSRKSQCEPALLDGPSPYLFANHAITAKAKSIMREMGSYVVSFEVGYSAMMSPASARLLYVKPKIFPLTVVLSAPKTAW